MQIEATVQDVTVYPDRARVVCRADCNVEQDVKRLLIGGLPLMLDVDSVRVSGRGTAAVRILGVDVAQQNFVDTPSEKVQMIMQELIRLQDEARIVTDRQAGLAERSRYLNGLRTATTEFAKGLSRGKTTIENQVELLNFLQTQDDELRTAVHEADIEKREFDKEISKLQRDLKQIQSARPRRRYQAEIEVDVQEAGEFQITLSYVVTQAGWKPLYDVRLVNDQLSITYIAQVTQNSGQDWDNVNLTVSTARPSLNQRFPELNPWYVDVQPPPRPRLQSKRVRSAMSFSKEEAVAEPDADMPVAMAAPTPVMREAEVVVAEVQHEGTAVSFGIPNQTNIPSDGSPHKTTVSQFQFDPKIDYVAVPKHTDAVFRRATVTNNSSSPLLKGPVNLFVGDEFIGKNQMKYTPINDELTLLLGVEERITIERTLERRDVDKRLLRDNRQLRYGYKVLVKNLLAQMVDVEVHDHIPVARHEQIKVKLEEAKPQPTKQSNLQLLEWHLSLNGESEKTITYEFLVEHPRSLQVRGLPK